VASVVHRRDPQLSYLAGGTVTGGRVDGQPLDPVEAELRVDEDELELTYTHPGRLRVVVRHTFAMGWGLRIAFSSLAAATQRVEGAELSLEPQPGCVAWALTLGATATYAVVPAAGTGPLLGGLLRLGSLQSAGGTGVQLTAFELRPDARYVLQLDWDWYENTPAFAQDRYGPVPSALVTTTGESVTVRVDEDVAVVAPAGLRAVQEGPRLELVSDIAGSFSVELRAARGTTSLQLQWVNQRAEVLRAAARAALMQPRSAAGVVRLAGVTEALVLQHALRFLHLDDPDEAVEALDLFTARLSAAGAVSPLEATYLCREFDRLGDPDLLVQAGHAVLDVAIATPGLGVAATQLCLALLVSSQSVDAVLAHLARLASQVATAPTEETAGVSEQAAALEVLAVTNGGPGATGGSAELRDLLPRIAALGLHLGAGLSGRGVTPLSPAVLSHLLAVFELLPDGSSSSMAPLWGCSAHVLARRATPELLARLEQRRPEENRPEQNRLDEAYAWLVLAVDSS